MQIIIDYGSEEERRRLEPLNKGVFPLVIENLSEFVVCGTRQAGAPVVHRHGNPTTLILQTVMLTEQLRTAITYNAALAAVQTKETKDATDRPSD